MARKRKTKKKYKKGGADGDTSTNVSTDSAAESTEEEKRNQERYGANILAAEEVPAPVVEFSKGRYFNPKVEESIELSENQQPCLICHNTEGPLINKGKYQLNVRIRKCPNCNSLFHRRCLAEWFSRKVCDGSDPSCPVCRINWPFEEDSIFLLEEEQHRIIRETQQPQRTEQQLQNIEIPVPTNRRNPFARLCRFISRRTRDIGNGTFFGTRRIRNNAVVPAPIHQGGRRKRRKKTRRRRRRGGTKRKRDDTPTPRRPAHRRRPNPQQQQPQENQDDEHDEYAEHAELMERIEANVDPDDPNFVQGGGSASLEFRGKNELLNLIREHIQGSGGIFQTREYNFIQNNYESNNIYIKKEDIDNLLPDANHLPIYTVDNNNNPTNNIQQLPIDVLTIGYVQIRKIDGQWFVSKDSQFQIGGKRIRRLRKKKTRRKKRRKKRRKTKRNKKNKR